MSKHYCLALVLVGCSSTPPTETVRTQSSVSSTGSSNETVSPEPGPCVGDALDFEQVMQHCFLEAESQGLPSEAALHISVEDPGPLRSGQGHRIWVRLTNQTEQPMAIATEPVGSGTNQTLVNEDGEVVIPWEEEMALGGTMGPQRSFVFTLLPHGHVRLWAEIDLRTVGENCFGGQCVRSRGDAIPAGEYMISIRVPLDADPLANVHATRNATATLTVVEPD